jgi:NADH:ubiquinone oxidoreductase subunit 6 (subunit J)
MVLALGFVLIVAKVLATTPQGFATTSSLNTPGQTIASQPTAAAKGESVAQTITQTQWDELDDTHQIGRLLFATNTSQGQTSYVAPFEITSLLILVATIGVIVLCKQEERPRPGRREEITLEAPPVAERQKEEVGR